MKTREHKKYADALNSVAAGRTSIESLLPTTFVIVMEDEENGGYYLDAGPGARLPEDCTKHQAILGKVYPNCKLRIIYLVVDRTPNPHKQPEDGR